MPNESANVPFRLVDGFLIVFEGSLGGLNGLKFILDTGATHSIVDRKLANRLGVHLHPTILFDFNKAIEVSEGTFSKVAFGSVQLANTSLLAGDLSDFSSFADGTDVIIGCDLLTLVNFAIDYDKGLLTFTSPAGAGVRAAPQQVGISVRLQIQDRPVELLVDTGAERIILFEDRLLNQIPGIVMQEKVTGVSIGRHVQATQGTIRKIYLGPRQIEPRVLLVKGPPRNVLPGIVGYFGTSSLNPHRIEFDFGRNSFKWR